jgi:hypothetical protein
MLLSGLRFWGKLNIIDLECNYEKSNSNWKIRCLDLRNHHYCYDITPIRTHATKSASTTQSRYLSITI